MKSAIDTGDHQGFVARLFRSGGLRLSVVDHHSSYTWVARLTVYSMRWHLISQLILRAQPSTWASRSRQLTDTVTYRNSNVMEPTWHGNVCFPSTQKLGAPYSVRPCCYTGLQVTVIYRHAEIELQ